MRWCRRIRWFFKDKKDNVKCFIIKKKYDKVINLAVKLWRMRNIENYEESFDEVRVIWEEFFFRAFKMMGMNKKSIKVLWEDFEMSNWKAMWFEGSEFENYTYRELFETFVGEAHYICDRLSIDRIFRTHWLFKEAFYNWPDMKFRAHQNRPSLTIYKSRGHIKEINIENEFQIIMQNGFLITVMT